MANLFDRQLIVLYLIILKLKETIEANLCKPKAKLIAMPILPSLQKSNLTPQPLPVPPPPPPPDSPWIISILEKIEHARQYEASFPWKTLSIYRVPKTLRAFDETAYTPKLVSLGPYHHGLLYFDSHKWRSLHHALTRTGHDVRLYLDAARSLEDRARSYYEAPISLSSDDFVESLVLDSIFTLELFRGYADEGFKYLGYSDKDPVFADNNKIMFWLQHDMIMLENQLPLFVLDWILALQLGREPSSSYLVAPLALLFFEDLMPTYEYLRPTTSSDPSYKALHCLDAFHHNFFMSAPPVAPASPWPRSSSIDWIWKLPILKPYIASTSSTASSSCPHDPWPQQFIHCVADLRNAGIKFCRRKSCYFWDIEFKDGVLYIPRLLIDDRTKSLFLNLIAFEHCHMQWKWNNLITSYVVFMDNLINSEVDVGYLHDMEIIDNMLGNDREVADMFNQLCQGVLLNFHECYLSGLSEQVNRYYKNKWNTWRASFTHKYFSNPWAFISLIAAVVLLLLTAAQTFYTVYPYYKPK